MAKELTEVVLPALETFYLITENVSICVFDEKRFRSRFHFRLTEESKDLREVIAASCCHHFVVFFCPERLAILPYGCISDTVKASIFVRPSFRFTMAIDDV